MRIATVPLAWVLSSVAAAPGTAWARPPGPSHSASVAAALYGGVGGPVCLAAAIMVGACVAMSLWSPRRGWRIAAGAGGAISVGLALVVARMSGGHIPATEIALTAGVLGLMVPALQAILRTSSEVA